MSNLPSGEPSRRLTLAELEQAVRAAEPAAILVRSRILRRVIKQDCRLTGFGLRVPHRKSYTIAREPLLEIVDLAELGLAEDAVLPEQVVLLVRPQPRQLALTPADDLLVGYWRLLFHARVHLALNVLGTLRVPADWQPDSERDASGRHTACADYDTRAARHTACVDYDTRAARHTACADYVGRWPPAMVRQRIERLGTAEFEEIRTVLAQEDLLLPPRSDASVYAEFVAVYLELQLFAGSLLPHCFPGLESLEAVDELVAQDVDAKSLFLATRPLGAPDPEDHSEAATSVASPTEREAVDEGVDANDLKNQSTIRPHPSPLPAGEGTAGSPLPEKEGTNETKYRRLMRKSQRPASLGNVVRAAIYRARAERCAPPEFAGRLRAAIKMDVYRLIRRLQAALELDDAKDQPWEESLLALVSQTPRGIWTAEARLLYDLQKVCLDHEREIYTVDLVEWVLSWGRRPIKRQLPHQRDVLMLKHLRSAARLVDAARISDPQRRELAVLIRGSQQRVEARLRQRLRPRITAALDEVGLVAQSLPERVARKKLVEELLDQASGRGFLTMGNLRDAISRNKLKLPDLAKPWDFFRGDQLLRADRKLSLALDGVYRRGEMYLRWMQRLSALGFGTRIGRFLTRFAVVPFGGSYVTVVFAHHVWQWIRRVGQPPPNTDMLDAADMLDTADMSMAAPHEGSHLTSPTVILVLGLFLLCLLNSAAFRRLIAACFKTSYRVFRAAAIEPIRWIIQSPLVQQIVHSRSFTLLFRFLLKPLLWTGAAWLLLPEEATRQTSAGTAVVIFLAVNLLLNSRLGRNLEELLADGIVQAWHRFGLRMIMGVFWLVVDVFKGILEAIERLMYSVDEWLRFRSGESGTMLVTKAVLGLVWFFVAYVVRLFVNVFLEPQINPIKHFPVVTVGHKLLFPLYKVFKDLLTANAGMDAYQAWLISGTTIWCLPGVFGFLVWELTANWRLYAANRHQNLFPVRIGAHGETMARLLKPGFHSGTLPKRFAKLRRAERHARAGGNWHPVHRHLQALGGIEAAIRRYVEREFLELLAESSSWQASLPSLEQVRLSTNGVKLAIACPGVAEATLQIALAVESGWLVAGVTVAGWADRLQPRERKTLATAIVGLYKSAGVELVRQQIEAQFPPPAPRYGVSTTGLLLWPDGDEDVEVLYDLQEGPWVAPQSVRGLARRLLPTVERQQLVFAETPVAWEDWVAVWSQDVAGQGRRQELMPPACVLPA